MKTNPANESGGRSRGRGIGAGKLRKSTFCAALFVSFALASSAEACTACMGDANSNFGEAANGAIFLMLGLLAVVFSLLGAFGFYLYRRALAPLPPHVEFTDGLDPQAEPGIS